MFWAEDTMTRKQESLRTRDMNGGFTLLHTKNESFRQPSLNPQIAPTYLKAIDPEVGLRAWDGFYDKNSRRV